MKKSAFAAAFPGEPILRRSKRYARWFVVKRMGKRLFRRVDRFLGTQSLVGNPAFFENGVFPWVAEFESQWPQIRKELDAILGMRDELPSLQDIQPDQVTISPDSKWKTFVLWGFGERSEPNCARCPDTSRAIERIPGMNAAWFSILAPGKHIPRHSGITKGNIRCHLGLKVPREREHCRFRVADEMRIWEEGHCLLFDDSCKHEVWNETDEERAVLILDFERPMAWRGRVVNRALQRLLAISPYVRDARRNQLAWEARLARLEEQGLGGQRLAAPPAGTGTGAA